MDIYTTYRGLSITKDQWFRKIREIDERWEHALDAADWTFEFNFVALDELYDEAMEAAIDCAEWES